MQMVFESRYIPVAKSYGMLNAHNFQNNGTSIEGEGGQDLPEFDYGEETIS